MPDVPSLLREYAERFEAALPGFLPQGDSPVEQAMRYGMEAGGKRLRPALVLAFCELFGGEPACALPFAAAVELVHGYSLIHDDLPCMDDDDFRRGRPSCHKAFGEAMALLAGDALLTQAFACLEDIRAVRILGQCAGVSGMIGGQQLDLLYEDMPISRAQLEDMNRKKTGALLAAACRLGCLAAGANEAQSAAAAMYADALGLLFQLTDDLLDADEEPGKATWVSLLGLDGARTAAQEYIETAQRAVSLYAQEGHFLHALPQWLGIRTV